MALTLEQLTGLFIQHIEDMSMHSGEGSGSGETTTTEVLQKLDQHTSAIAANTASITDLAAVYFSAARAVIEHIQASEIYTDELGATVVDAENAFAKFAELTTAVIGSLDADQASIRSLVAQKASVTELEALEASIETMFADYIRAEDIVATNVKVSDLLAYTAQFLSSVTSSLTASGVTAYQITSDHLTINDAFIKNAMIDSINASKITAGTLDTGSVTISGDDGHMIIADGTIQISDANDTVRVQLGRTAQNDFTLIVLDSDGNPMWNATGLTEDAIKSAIITDAMVSDNANISGSKIDLPSLVNRINTDNTATINASHIIMDTDNQQLSAWFSTINEWRAGVNTNMSTLSTSITMLNGQLATKVSQTAIDEINQDLEDLSSQMSSLEQTATSITATITDVQASIEDLQEMNSNIDNMVHRGNTIVDCMHHNLPSDTISSIMYIGYMDNGIPIYLVKGLEYVTQ